MMVRWHSHLQGSSAKSGIRVSSSTVEPTVTIVYKLVDTEPSVHVTLAGPLS